MFQNFEDLAEELLDILDLDDILEINDLTELEVLAVLIKEGMISQPERVIERFEAEYEEED